MDVALRELTVEALAPLAGLAAGTPVLTLRGEVPVESLRAGDRVVTREGAVTVEGVEAVAARVAPVRIAAGSLGHGRPDRDLEVGPGTRLHVRDWRARALFGGARALVEAARLVDGEFVTEGRPRGLTLWTIRLGREAVIYAGGVEVGV